VVLDTSGAGHRGFDAARRLMADAPAGADRALARDSRSYAPVSAHQRRPVAAKTGRGAPPCEHEAEVVAQLVAPPAVELGSRFRRQTAVFEAQPRVGAVGFQLDRHRRRRAVDGPVASQQTGRVDFENHAIDEPNAGRASSRNRCPTTGAKSLGMSQAARESELVRACQTRSGPVP
jgi:hypothetical protein